MQTTRLPVANCTKIQSIIKQFVLGSSEHRKGIPLLKWSSMCQPKQHGGCGMKDMISQNSAFLMKLAYSIRTQPNILWVQVLRSKYKWHEQRPKTRSVCNASYLWRSISAIWEDLDLGCKWNIGNGRTARFWSDHWIGDLGPLSQLSFCPINEAESRRTISEFISQDGQWKWDEIQGKLPQQILQDISNFKFPHDQDIQDSITWCWGSRFSVKSAYNLLMQDQWDDESKLWSLAWSWRGPQRVRIFLWLVLKDRLLTNKERVRRHMTDDDTCGICGQEPEDIDHIFRRCTLARTCWNLIMPSQSLRTFLDSPFNHWLLANMKLEGSNILWNIFFGIICWKL